ncbi:zinc metalloprotease HtpX [Methylomarinum sp. Ch1-1]|uniref:Zinc metalloprotease HtpX n=1 Tax=Methylomarinum roseum TaxID=3067653 RepID=A0AAU7NWF9_9GAMM|nr:zinc metalloprotease HtpX [Methylomarinum sp. Ch1-1]MDP4522611.1 zinc metalloprotease HtpX [Methylomarinum sp. Ch1-1]
MALDVDNWKQHSLANRMQTLLLLVVMGSLMLLLGYLLWEFEGVIALALMCLLLLLLNPRFTPNLIMSLYGAYPLPPHQAPLIHRAIEELSRRAGLSKAPSLHYIPSRTLNAFSVGQTSDASIGISDGLLRALNIEELVAVLAHEISHIGNNDMGVMGLADMFSRLTSLLSLFGQLLLLLNLPLILLTDATINWFAIILLILSPNICALAQLGLSRTREYNADLNAARLTGAPETLARALIKIEHVQGGWMERVFFPGRRIPEPSLLRTHPPTQERVRRLMELKIPETVTPLPLMLGSSPLQDILQRRTVKRRPRWHINGLWH